MKDEETSEKPAAETLAAIVRELRHSAEVVEEDHDEDTWSGFEAAGIYRDLADRIEAATEREISRAADDAASKATLDRTAKDAAEYMAYAMARNSAPQPGNAAAMREALERAIDAIETLIALYDEEHTAAVKTGATWERSDTSEVNAIVEQVRAALSAPPRNCDRFDTHNDAKAAFLRSYFGPTEPEFVEDAFARWLFAPVEGGNKQ